LTVGLTSPELENMLRAVFVKRAIQRLPPVSRSKRPASDVRVGLAAGLHRNEVRRIRSAKEELTMARGGRRSRTERLLRGWATDPRFSDSGGHPRDLPLTSSDRGPSFEELTTKYLPGVAPGTAIRELRRQAVIQVLPDEVFRLRASASRTAGFGTSNIVHAGKRLQRVASGILNSIGEGNGESLYREISNLRINPEEIPLIRRTLERRTQVFLDSIERELKARSGARPIRRSTKIGISVVSWRDV
jgi:hypothetical protein